MRGKHPRVPDADADAAESAHVPEVDPFGWKPTMTPEEADAWLIATGSKIRTPLFHGTAPWRAANIMRDGFRTRPTKAEMVNKQLYGQGAYLTDSDAYAHKYAGALDEGLLETRVALTHPASLAETHDLLKKVKARNLPNAQFASAVREEAERQGFDGLRVEFWEPSMGQNAPAATSWIVFDPHKIVVVRKHKAMAA
jgi:hypothetical protein